MRVIKDFPNYSITSDGKVWNNKYKRWLKPIKQPSGYLTVNLGRGNRKFIHRLVLEVFVGPCPDGMESCHNNGIKTDNELSNLRWDTRSNNIKDSIKHGTAVCIRVGEKSNHHKLTRDDVEEIIELCDTGLYTQKEIADIYSVDASNISYIINKKTWKHLWKGGV